MGKEIEKLTFFQTRHTNEQWVQEKVFNITHHQGNANQNHMRYHLTPVKMCITKKTRENKH